MTRLQFVVTSMLSAIATIIPWKMRELENRQDVDVYFRISPSGDYTFSVFPVGPYYPVEHPYWNT